MSTGGLRGVINANLIKRFQSISGGSRSVVKGLQGGSSASTVNVGLKTGAQTYAKAAQGFNIVTGFVNMAQAALTKLQDITDKMIVVCERASKSGGSQSSYVLESEFRKLTKEFKKTISDAKVKDRKYLTVEGLSELFTLVGLDSEKSDQITNLFKKFWTADAEGNLASEKVKEHRHVSIPSSVAGTPRTVTTVSYYLDALTLDQSLQDWQEASATQISAKNSLLEKDGSILVVSADCQETALIEADRPVESKAINKLTGEFIVATQADLLGFNPNNATNLFLYNSAGQLQEQLTRISDTSVEIGAVALSDDGTKFVYAGKSSSTEVPQLIAGSVGLSSGDVPTEPSLVIDNNQAGVYSSFTDVSFSFDGQSIAYFGTTQAEKILVIKDLGSATPQTILQDATIKHFGWLSSDTAAVSQDSNGNGIADSLSRLSLPSGTFELFQDNLQIERLATIPGETARQGYIAIWDPGAVQGDTLRIITGEGTNHVSFLSFPAASKFDALNMSFNEDGLLELGMLANFDGGDSQSVQSYRVSAVATEELVRPFVGIINKSERLFDGVRRLSNPAEAFSLMVDLKALRRQIDENYDVLDQARDVLIEHLQLVRAAGNAFLDLSKTINTDAEADQVAYQLQQQIRANYRAAISHTNNLDSITAAALLMDDKTFS